MQSHVCDFRHLRGLAAAGIDFTGCYFSRCRFALKTCPAAAGINGAKISRAFFPIELSAEEISLTIQHGTRMRYQK